MPTSGPVAVATRQGSGVCAQLPMVTMVTPLPVGAGTSTGEIESFHKGKE